MVVGVVAAAAEIAAAVAAEAVAVVGKEQKKIAMISSTMKQHYDKRNTQINHQKQQKTKNKKT